MINLYDGLIDWWGLGDFAGNGSPLLDDGPGGHDGNWITKAGIAMGPDRTGTPGECVRCCTSECKDCPCPETLGFQSTGWSRVSGIGGGYVPYPGGAAWYDPQNFTFSFWYANYLIPPFGGFCPVSVQTDFPQQPWGVGVYDTFPTYVSFNHHIYGLRAAYVSDGSVTPEDDPVHWVPWADDPMTFKWSQCYGEFIPLYYGGCVGDHVGFPSNAGWMFRTNVYHDPDEVSNPFNPMSPGWILMFDVESNTAFPEVTGAVTGRWGRDCTMITLRVDGTNIDIFQNGAMTRQFPGAASSMVSSQSGIGFNWVDRNKALSGEYEIGQGSIDEALLWDRPLSDAEIRELWGQEWCKKRFHLEAAYRAQRSGSADASRVAAARHLSGTRFRADPKATPAADGAGGTGMHLSSGRFRSKR